MSEGMPSPFNFRRPLKGKSMNKYYRILERIITEGKMQTNKKGSILYLLNEQLSLTPADLLDVFEGHNIARKKLRSELQLFMQGERNVEKYREAGINWWDYCGSILVNSYPTYFEKLPPLIRKINRERRNSKNYVLFLGETGAESNQAPCLSLYSSSWMRGSWCCPLTGAAATLTSACRLTSTTFT